KHGNMMTCFHVVRSGQYRQAHWSQRVEQKVRAVPDYSTHQKARQQTTAESLHVKPQSFKSLSHPGLRVKLFSPSEQPLSLLQCRRAGQRRGSDSEYLAVKERSVSGARSRFQHVRQTVAEFRSEYTPGHLTKSDWATFVIVQTERRGDPCNPAELTMSFAICFPFFIIRGSSFYRGWTSHFHNIQPRVRTCAAMSLKNAGAMSLGC